MDALTFLSSRVAFFDGVSAEELTGLAVNSVLKQCAPGQAVLRAGMSVDALHVVATGTVEVHAKVPGKGLMRLAELGSGEVFGEASILEQSLAGATVKAGEAGAVVLSIPEAPFRDLIVANETFGARVRALIQARRSPQAAKV